MNYLTFSDDATDQFQIAFLAPKLERDGMVREYIEPYPFDPAQIIGYDLYQEGKKTKRDIQKQYLDELLPILEDIGVTYLVVCEGEYFKTLTGAAKADPYIGYICPNVYPESKKGQFKVIYCPNYRQVFYNPEPTRAKIKLSLTALWDDKNNSYVDPGDSIIHFAEYPMTAREISLWLDRLVEENRPLTADIETFSLKHYSAGIGTISFAWSKHEGIAFPVDLIGEEASLVRELLVKFFLKFDNNLTWHKISFDVCVLIYQLFMDHLTDQKGLLTGLDVMTKNWYDTRIIAYLATNSCAGNKLGLKELSQEFAGNYAQDDIKDITLIPLDVLLQYNLVDCLATWFVKEKYWDIMVQDDQLEVYQTIFKPAMVDIIHTQLVGMPLNMERVKEVKDLLGADRDTAIASLQNHILVQEFTNILREDHVRDRNAALKTKVISITDQETLDVVFNPNSTPQKQRLLFEFLELPVLERTKTKQPSTSGEIIEKLKAYTEDPKIREMLDVFLDYAAVDKIYGTFIPAMETAQKGRDGWHYLFGNFNLGGTVSGRLSSSEPNLQTIPANGKTKLQKHYAKLIKSCFQAPPGWLFVGLDFSSLEDRISALTTKDPNKLKVYVDGFDGHCLRAHSYFMEDMPDIEDTVDSINSIAEKYPAQRQDSKGPTFALTYQGTFIALMAKFGFSEKMAKQIEARYHQLYKASDDWVAEKLEEASRTGYITVAFGLRVRTPLLKQVIRGTSRTPFEAEAEGRTAGNALGQSWGLLNSRAVSEFLKDVRISALRELIRPCAQIHDASYYMIPDDIDVLHYTNTYLVKAVEWQDHPDIAHDQVKLGGSLTVFYPSWAEEISIPNYADKPTILQRVADTLSKRKAKKAA